MYKRYSLSEDDIFIDGGSFRGEFIEKITDYYDCKAFGFEPLSEYAEILNQKFINNPKVKIIDSALSSEDGSAYFNEEKTITNGRLTLSNLDDTMQYGIYKISDDTISLIYLSRGNFLTYYK